MQVQLHQIALALAGRSVLTGLDLSTKPDEYVVILGPSGCGKTTTLRIIAGLQRPDRGEVLFDETPVTSLSPRRRKVSMVFQGDGLYPHVTIEKSIRLGIPVKIGELEVRARLSQAIELTRIQGLLDRYPDQLSGGELRRAAVAKAIARQSPVRLLDEPLSALDASARHSLQDDLLRWHHTVPGTTIHVTHDGYEAMRMADRIAILDRGRITQFDSPTKIYHHPRNIIVALAIGSPSINLIPAKIEQGRVVSRDPRVQLTIDFVDGGSDRDVLVGVRPEALQATVASDQDNDDTPFRGIEIETQLLKLREGIHECTLLAQLDATLIHGVAENPARVASHVGKTIRLRCPESKIHLFEADTGQRLHTARE